MELRCGDPNDRGALEEIQRRASAAMPEYRDAILRHPESVELPSGLFNKGRVRVAKVGSVAVAFRFFSRRRRGSRNSTGCLLIRLTGAEESDGP